MSVFPHLCRESLLTHTTKSAKASDVSPCTLKENCPHYLRKILHFGNEGIGHGLAMICSLKIQEIKIERENEKSNVIFTHENTQQT